MNRIAKMAEKICLVKRSCNEPCNPVKTCDALRYAAAAIDAGYGQIDEVTKDVIAEFEQALEGVDLTAEAFQKICDIKLRCGYKASDRDSRLPIGSISRLDYDDETMELAKFIGDYNMKKGSIDERYIPYVQDVARAIVDEGWHKNQPSSENNIIDKLHTYCAPLIEKELCLPDSCEHCPIHQAIEMLSKSGIGNAEAEAK